MNFANLTPAERMKASALIGLIVVILFFVVHYLLGAVAPKRPAPVPGQAPLAATSAQPGQPGAPENASPAETFPTAKIASARKSTDPEPDLAIPDPFRPAHIPPGPAGFSRPVQQAPKVEVMPPNSQPLPPLIPGESLSGQAPLPGAPEKAPQVEPEIRVVGIVHARPSVATLEVWGRTVLARPGDALATGWRLQGVEPDGVRIRHDGALIPVRVGSAINEPEGKKQ